MVRRATTLVNCYINLVKPSNLPNLRRLFVEARTEAEESAYSRNAVSLVLGHIQSTQLIAQQFYNLVCFMSSVAVFSIAAQRMSYVKDSIGA